LTLSTIDNELTKVETDAERAANPRSLLRRRWELNFLNTVGKIATLIQLRRYPEDLKNYFELEFRWAKHLIENSVEREVRENQYKEILQICNTRGWDTYDPGDPIWNPQ
jgi:hypothetical protein